MPRVPGDNSPITPAQDYVAIRAFEIWWKMPPSRRSADKVADALLLAYTHKDTRPSKYTPPSRETVSRWIQLGVIVQDRPELATPWRNLLRAYEEGRYNPQMGIITETRAETTEYIKNAALYSILDRAQILLKDRSIEYGLKELKELRAIVDDIAGTQPDEDKLQVAIEVLKRRPELRDDFVKAIINVK